MSTDLSNTTTSVTELVEKTIEVIETSDLNCFVSYNKEKALSKAKDIQTRLNQNEKSSELMGYTIAVDDNIFIKEEIVTASSKMLNNFKGIFSSTVVNKLDRAGLITIGKTNISELTVGIGTDSSFKGVTPNPINKSLVGLGAPTAINNGIVPFAIGSDCNGSAIRHSVQSGINYIKPTYGTVSRFGLIANTSSMEQIGIYTKVIEEGYKLLSIIAGHDKNDGTMYPDENYNYQSDNLDINSLKIGVPKEYLSDIDEDIKNKTNEFVKKIECAGAKVEEFSFPLADVTKEIYLILSSAEFSNNISRFDGVKYGYRTKDYKNIEELLINSRTEAFEIETKLKAILGAFVLSEGSFDKYYYKALQIRRLIKEKLEDIFTKYDCILLPAYGSIPVKSKNLLKEPKNYYKDMKYTSLALLTGTPSLSMPYGKINGEIPCGIQLITKEFNEKVLLQLGKFCEDNQIL